MTIKEAMEIIEKETTIELYNSEYDELEKAIAKIVALSIEAGIKLQKEIARGDYNR